MIRNREFSYRGLSYLLVPLAWVGVGALRRLLLSQLTAIEAVTGAGPWVAAATEVTTQQWSHAVSPAPVPPPPARHHDGRARCRVLPSWPAIRAVCAYPLLALRGFTPTRIHAVGSNNGGALPLQALHTPSSGCRMALPPWRGPPWSTTPPSAATRSTWHRCSPQGPHRRPCGCMTCPAGTASKGEAGTLSY